MGMPTSTRILSPELIALTAPTHRIELTIAGHVAYLAKEGAEFDGNWFTRKIECAKTYKLARNAEKRIKEQGSSWDDLAARVVKS